MSKEEDMLRQIVEASDAIRRKHRMIKEGKNNAEQAMQDAFKPIVTPLEKLVMHQKEKASSVKQEPKEEVKEEEKSDMNSSLDDVSFQSAFGEDYDGDTTLTLNANELIDEYLGLLTSNRKTSLDISYGVRNLSSNKLMIGDSPIIFHSRDIHIRDKKYPKTVGLVELLFKKEPNAEYLTFEDLKNYEDIVISTNAHRKFYKSGEAIRADNSSKYRDYIAKIANQHTGKGMLVARKNTKFDYVYWDDPNELVDRLRLLLASQAAGNSAHSNEITRIIEELREAQIIY